MAWNPSPAVAVARDAAAKLGTLAGSGVEQLVIAYITDDNRTGIVTYGRTAQLCSVTKKLGDSIYKHIQDYYRRHGMKKALKRVTGLTGDVTGLWGDVDECQISPTARAAGVNVAALTI